MTLTLDASNFLAGLDLANQAVARGAARGMGMAMMQVEKLAKEAVPVRTGTLAGTIVADPKAIKVEPDQVVGAITAGGGEASDYALVQHEMPLTHSHPTSGVYASKYIETPLKTVSGQFGPVVAAEIRRELGS